MAEVKAFHGDILGEITRAQIQAQMMHLVDAGHGQQAYLSVGQDSGVGVANKPMLLFK